MCSNLKELLSYSHDLKVLFIEDNKDVKIQLYKLLENFFTHIDSCTDGQEAFDKYTNFKDRTGQFYDLIITDISMPKLDGIELSRAVINLNPTQLILVISAHTESDKLLELIDIGIFKFLEKPVIYTDLIDTLSSAINKIKKEKRLFELEEKVKNIKNDNIILNKLAITDKLTSVYNRRYLDNKLYENFERLDTFTQKHLSLIFIDIDNFKSINDTYGHLIGDKILIEFSNLIRKNIREGEIFGRWGGEEFVIICEMNSEKTYKLAEKLRLIVEENEFIEVKNLTASFGVASYETGDKINKLIKKADSNLYKAKTEGKNRVCYSNLLLEE